MSIEQDSLEVVVPEQLAAVSQEFVTFLEKYYEWMNLDGNPSERIANSIVERNLWTATDEYLDYLYEEFGYAWIQNRLQDRANIVARLSDIYKTRGSLDSIKILFRALFGEEVEIKLPKEYILKPSTGLWAQEYSVICDLQTGDPNDVIGRFSTVTTQFPNQPVQKFDVEIKSINPRGPGVYELYISRFFAGFFFDGSTIEFENTKFLVKESLSNLIATTVPGATFKAGDAYSIQHYKRNQTWDYINDELTGTTQEKYQNLFRKYFETQTFNRWYRDITRINIEKQEQVELYSFTDGTVVEEVTRDRLTKTIVSRGASVLTTYKATDGTTKQEKKTLAEGEFIAAPDITINWDDIIIQMIQYVEGIGSPALASFFEEEVDGFKRGDTNLDGVIDETDVEMLLRRVTGRTVKQAYHQWIDQKVGAEIRSREIGAALEVGDGQGAWYRITEVDNTGAIQSGLVFSFGYNYPTVYTAILVPANGEIDDHAEVVFSSKIVAVSAAEYRNRKGFISDINKIFDNYYYQEFSYVVESSLDNEVVENVIQRSVHPAGQKLFSERVIIVNMEYPGIGLSSAHHYGFPSVVSNLFTALEMERPTATDQAFPPWSYIEKSLTEANGYPDEFVIDDPLWKHHAEKFIEAANGYNEGTEIEDYNWGFTEKSITAGNGYVEDYEIDDLWWSHFYKARSDAFEISNEVYYNHPNKARQDYLGYDDVWMNYVEKQAYTEGFIAGDTQPSQHIQKTLIYQHGSGVSTNPYFEEFDGDWPDAPDYMFNQFDYIYDTPGTVWGINVNDTIGMEYVKAPFQEYVNIQNVYQNWLNKSRRNWLDIDDVQYSSVNKAARSSIALYSGDFYNDVDKALSESLSISELIDKVLGRDVFSYGTQVDDIIAMLYEKDLGTESLEIGDGTYQDPVKYREDGTQITDVWDSYFEKALSDSTEITEVYAASFIKDRSDSTEISDGWFNDVEKPFADVLNIGESYLNSFDKYKSDSIEITSVFNTSFVKNLAESLELAEVFSASYYKYKTDNLDIIDVNDASIEKPFAESIEVSGVVASAINKYATDSVSLSGAGTVAHLRDYVQLTDNYVVDNNYVIYGDDDPYTF